MNHRKRSTTTSRPSEAVLDNLIEQITADASGDGEQLWAFLQVFTHDVAVPFDAFVLGVPVTVTKFDFDGNERRGLTANCRRADGSEYVVAAADVVGPPGAPALLHLAAYRKWMGLAPHPAETKIAARAKVPRQVAAETLTWNGSLELAVLSLKGKTARCQVLGSDRTLTLAASRIADVVPAEIAVVRAAKQSSRGGVLHVSGEIVATRIDAAALGLVPLQLHDRGIWKPSNTFWGEEGEPIQRWAKPMIARGPRPAFEMEQVLPGADPDDFNSDPIIEANDRKNAGDATGAYNMLMQLCEADLRCLDAHAHLGNFAFDRPEQAVRHYEAGFRIGELSLGEKFDGLLPWGSIDNRPFLRCMHGFGLCLWRLNRLREAAGIFKRMLWLNPTDNQGARFLIDDVRAKRAWEDRREP